MSDETERPEDTVRRYAGRLVAVERMLEDELIRLTAPDLRPVQWWERRRRHWVQGVEDARSVSAQHLRLIREALDG